MIFVTDTSNHLMVGAIEIPLPDMISIRHE
jgi:hypothetical protein